MKKVKSILSLMVASMLLFTACVSSAPGGASSSGSTGSTGSNDGGNDSGEYTKISILTSQDSYFADVHVPMTEKMKELYGYDIDWQVLPDDQYYVLVKSKVATGDVPDIIEYNTPSNNVELNVAEKVVPLDDQPWISRLVNPTLLADPNDGKIYAQPRDSGTFFGAVYYNKDVLENLGVSTEQPKTMDELFDRMREVKEKSNGEVTPVAFSNNPSDSWTTQIFMTLGYSVYNYPNDLDIYNKLLNNEMKFTEAPGFKEVLATFKKIFDEGLANENHLSATYDEVQESVGAGTAAMAFHGEWFPSAVAAKHPEATLGTWVIPYNDNLIMGTGAYVRAYFVMKDGKQVDTTLDFLDKWSSPEIQNIFFEKRPGFPAFTDVNGGDVDPCVTDLVDNYLSTGKFTYQINDPMGAASAIFPELWSLYADMLANNREPEDILKDWQVIYEDFMKQNQQPGF